MDFTSRAIRRAWARIAAAGLFLAMSGCAASPQAASSGPADVPALAAAAAATATATLPQPTATTTAEPTATEAATLPPPTPTPPAAAVCSPLQGYSLEALQKSVSNPYHPPKPGSDDPHHGVDLANVLPGTSVAVEGLPVQAALAGKVAGVIPDRFPFGNALIVETPLDDLPAGWRARLQLSAPDPNFKSTSALTCPPADFTRAWSYERTSLYVLYAHLKQRPTLQPGDTLACGQAIGAIGKSGNALNPHLHFEVRVGPAGVQIPQMAHYDASATQQEMAAYCTWSISGIFQMTDPLKILDLMAR